MSKPLRSLVQKTVKPYREDVTDLYKMENTTTIWGSDHHANFIDVISLAPITGIQEMFINEVNIDKGEFPKSNFFQHDGDGKSTPWSGQFPYVEKTILLNKQAKAKEEGESISTTSFVRQVSNVGVAGIRINFSTPSFTHKDNKSRNKTAMANFKVHLLNSNGARIKTVVAQDTRHYYTKNPTSISCTLMVETSTMQTVWSYEVEMGVYYNYYRTAVLGNWTASTVTELYNDTQTYDKIAYCSGDLVASEFANQTPKRQYLVEGYKVRVPVITNLNGKDVFLGQFTQETSDSYAWNTLAVLTDDLWGAGLPIDRINIISFLEFHRYCQTQVDGNPRYSHSQYLIKPDNYFKLAQQMVGNADGKLYEDTTGRIGVLIDRETDKRRVITSYDIVDEKVKRTTVPNDKKINQVQVEFEDETNNYKKTIITESDQDSITLQGIVSKKLKLDTCTNPLEARRIAKKVLVTSQVASSSYVIKVGHTHDDVQIGDVIALFDRNYSRSGYCGKFASGTSKLTLNVDKRTPIDIDMITNPQIVIDNDRGDPIIVDIDSYTDDTIVLSQYLSEVPQEFKSFGIQSKDDNGLKPTLLRVLGTSNSNGVTQIEGVDYNHSLYSHVENGTSLVIPNNRHLPSSVSQEITGLSLSVSDSGITAQWDRITGWSYTYFWKRYSQDDPANGKLIVSPQELPSETTSTLLPAPLDPVKYSFSIYATDGTNATDVKVSTTTLNISESGNSALPPATNIGVKDPDTGLSVGTYDGRDFTIMWDQDTAAIPVNTFIIRVSQSGETHEVRVSGSLREVFIPEADLIETFGIDFIRDFNVTVIAIDEDLVSNPPASRLITNTAPIPPSITVRENGDVGLSGTRPSDAIGSIVTVWRGTQLDPPANATVVESSDMAEINIPEGTIVYDSGTYTYTAAWVDDFGKVGVQTARTTFIADPALLVPESPELLQVISVTDTSVKVDFSHSGIFLKRLKIYLRKKSVGGSWLGGQTIYDIPAPAGETSHGYDVDTGEGFIMVTGLARNTEYEFMSKVANDTSSFSEESNIVTGTGVLSINIDDILEDLDEDYLGIDPRDMLAEGVNDAFEDYQSTDSSAQAIYEQRIDNKNITASVNLLGSRFEDQNNSNEAEFSNVKKLITDESEARGIQVETLETKTDETNAEVVNLSQTVSTQTSALSQQITSLSSTVDTNKVQSTALFTSLSQATATETAARVQQDNQLTAKINEDVAEAKDEATAAIGYCTIGGNVSSHDNKISCEAATGTWVESPLAQAVRNVQVTSGASTATVGSMYSAQVDVHGQIIGKATIGVNVNGEFTGLDIVNGGSQNEMVFKAGGFKFKDSTGADQLSYSAGTWNFTGTVRAEKIQGDVVGILSKELDREISGLTDNLLSEINISSDTQDRTLKIDPIHFNGFADGNINKLIFTAHRKVGNSAEQLVYTNYVKFESNSDDSDSTPIFTIDIPANSDVKIRLLVRNWTSITYQMFVYRTLFVSLYRQSASMSFS